MLCCGELRPEHGGPSWVFGYLLRLAMCDSTEGEGRGWKRRAGADPELESESESGREKKGAEECTRGRKSFERHDAVAISEAAMQYAGLNEAKRQ